MILLDKSKMLHKPVDRRRQIAIAYVRQNRIDGHRAILHGDSMIVAEIGYRVYQPLYRDNHSEVV